MKLILIVDDEIDITETFSLLFEVHGYEVLTATNGREALKLLQERVPDLIISDCMMPVMDGITFRKQVQQDPVLGEKPFVLMSAAPDQHDLASVKIDRFLKKPFQFDELIDTVQTLLHK